MNYQTTLQFNSAWHQAMLLVQYLIKSSTLLYIYFLNDSFNPLPYCIFTFLTIPLTLYPILYFNEP